jgi:hypothetical protein
MPLLLFTFQNPSQVTFRALRKYLIYKEIPDSLGFNFSAKPLISLKKNDLHLRRYREFLIQCKKVQLSGEKCLCWCIPTEKGRRCVSRGFIAESGCQRAVVCTDPAP